MNTFVLFIKNLLIHLTLDIRPLIKLSFNTPKSTRGLDALSSSNMNQRMTSMQNTQTCFIADLDLVSTFVAFVHLQVIEVIG
jgi:hypothetical protein